MLEIVVGTYEELLLGYKIDLEQEEPKCVTSFTDHSHIGCIKSVAISRSGFLASGSTDEVIRLFNLNKRVEMGALIEHDGSITSVEFFGKTDMLSSSEDGSICVWKTKKWECVRRLRGHKGPVHSFAIHPTGKLAISVSRDKTMKTWNLMTGKRAYTTNTKLPADLVRWSPDGTRYLISTNNKLDVYSVETSKVERTIQYPSRIYVIDFIQRNTLLLAGEGGVVQLIDLNTGEKVHQLSTDTNRIRGACLCKHDGDAHLLATASSDGIIQLWKLTPCDKDWSSEKLVSHDTQFRLTCLAMMTHRPRSTGRDQQQPMEEEEEEVEDEESSEDEEKGDEESSGEEEVEANGSEAASSESDVDVDADEDNREQSRSNKDAPPKRKKPDTNTKKAKVATKTKKRKVDSPDVMPKKNPKRENLESSKQANKHKQKSKKKK